MAKSIDKSRNAYEGVKVLDFSWALIGPIVTKYMADHGATVVRVESAARPCFLRGSAPFKDGKAGLERSGYYAFFNANKYSIAIDLNHKRALEVVRRLINWADVVAENFMPGVMEKWGLGYEDIKRIKPDIIMLRVSNRGQAGPRSKHSTLGVPVGGEAGFSYITGWPDRAPLPLPLAYLDSATPRLAMVAVGAALIHRRRTGVGQCLDMSQLESGVQLLAPELLGYFANGAVAERAGNSCPYAAPHAAYRCRADKWCVITVFTDEEWEAFGRALGSPAWVKDNRFATVLARKKNEKELDELIEAWTANLSADEVASRMQSAGVPAAVVASGEQVLNDPQLKESGFFWEMEHPEMGKFHYLGESFKLSKTPAQARMPSPLLGEHTEYVCTQMLGMSADELADIKASGALR